MSKKVVASKRPRGSSSSEYDRPRLVSANVEARFHDSVTRRSGIRERGFDIDVENTRLKTFRELFRVGDGNSFANTPKPLQ